MKHANAAVFIPHQGCQHACSFCSQRDISGVCQAPTPAQVREILEQAVKSLGERVESAQIAFFGGSFTAVDPGYRRALLKAAQPYLGRGFDGIRISTRPDAIDENILDELKQYGVTAIELGAQSMVDQVLSMNRRGHTAEQTKRASILIQEKEFSLGLQMMTGLYGDNDEGAWETSWQLAALRPDTMRIYPTLVLENTTLAKLYKAGRYRPQKLEDAVALCAGLLEFFDAQGIPVIRLGLHDSESLSSTVLAGPRHPAFRELCESRILYKKAVAQIEEQGLSGRVRLAVHPGSVSKMSGQKRANISRLRERGVIANIDRDSGLDKLQVRVTKDQPKQDAAPEGH